MLKNAYFLAKIGADTAENEQHFAKFCHFAAPARSAPLAPALGGRAARRPFEEDLAPGALAPGPGAAGSGNSPKIP